MSHGSSPSLSSSFSSTDSDSSLSSYTHNMATYHESLFLQAESLQRQFLDNRRNAKPVASEPEPELKQHGIQRMHAKKQALGQQTMNEQQARDHAAAGSRST